MLLLTLVSGLALAQADADLSRALTEKTHALVERFVSKDRFQLAVVADAKSDSKVSALPYLPTSQAPNYSIFSLDELRSHAAAIRLTLSLGEEINDETRATLKTLLTDALKLDTTKQDAITFTTLNIQAAKKEDPRLRDLEKTLATSQRRLEQITSERDTGRSELAALKATLEKAIIENQTLKTTAKSAAAAAAETATTEKTETSAILFWILGGIGALVALMLVVSAWLLARSYGRAGDSLQSGLTTVAQAIEVGGASQTDASVAALPEASAGGKDLPAVQEDLNAAYHHACRLRDEILDILDTIDESYLIQILNKGLVNPAAFEKTVYAMELLGKDKANSLFQKLGEQQQQDILMFLRSGTRSVQKRQMMIEAGEELKTSLMQGYLNDARRVLDQTIAVRVDQLTEEGLLAIMATMNSDGALRLAHYLTPERLAACLIKLQTEHREAYDRFLAAFYHLPEFEKNSDLDKIVAVALDTEEKKQQEDTQRPYLKYYEQLIAAVPESLSEDLLQTATSTNARVATHLAENVITISTLFRLHGDYRDEIIDKLSNKHIATLQLSLPEEQLTLLSDSLDLRRQPIIDDEKSRLSSGGERGLASSYAEAKAKVVTAIKKLKGDDPLKNFLASVDAATADSEASDKDSLPAGDREAS